MADPITMMAVGSIGTSVAGGILGAGAAKTNAAAAQVGIQGQMLSTLGQAFGFQVQAEQYDYQANISKYQAAVADINTKLAKQNAAYARDEGEVEASQLGMKEREERGLMTVTQGASGLDVAGGSATRVRESMIQVGYYDQAVTRSNAAKKAYGYDIEAMQSGAQADIFRYTASEQEAQATESLKGASFTMAALPLEQQAYGLAGKAGDIGAMSSLVSGAGSVANKWVQGTQAGIFPKFGT